MKLPYPTHLDRTDIIVNISDGITSEGEDNIIFTFRGKCRFIEKIERIVENDGTKVLLRAKAIIKGDIAPELPIVEGEVEVNNIRYNIYQSMRPRNPDGSIHHTALELI